MEEDPKGAPAVRLQITTSSKGTHTETIQYPVEEEAQVEKLKSTQGPFEQGWAELPRSLSLAAERGIWKGMSTMKHVLAISGGKDSAALAIYMKDKYPSLDMTYYFTDTGKELDETYQLIERLEGYLGKPIARSWSLRRC